MAIITSGPFLGASGTFNGVTYSQDARGRTIASALNKASSVAPNLAQKTVTKDTAVFAKFMKPFQDFVNVGYEVEAKIRKVNPYNAMVACTRKDAMQGKYPRRTVNCSKVLVTKGSLPAATAAVTMCEAGLTFSWNTDLIPNITHYSDQVIMVAYFPKLKEVRYIAGGVQRRIGKDFLELAGIKKGNKAEVYLSFVTDNRKGMSDSVYLGQFNW